METSFSESMRTSAIEKTLIFFLFIIVLPLFPLWGSIIVFAILHLFFSFPFILLFLFSLILLFLFSISPVLVFIIFLFLLCGVTYLRSFLSV